MYIGDWLFVIFILIFLWKIKWIRPFNAINEAYLGRNNTNAVKGLFSLVPLFVHILNVTEHGVYADWWGTYGNVSVGGFFFFSGYGLMVQCMKKPDYDKGFLSKHFPKILIPYVAVTILAWAATFAFKGFLYPVSGIFHAIKCGDPIVPYSWYIIHLLVFYLWFYLSMKLSRGNKHFMVALALAYYVLTTIFVYNMGHVYDGYGQHWYQSSLGIPLGMAFAAYAEEITRFMKKCYWLVFALVFGLVLIVYNYGVGPVANLFPDDFGTYNVIVRFLMLLVCILAMMKLEIGNPILNFLGSITLELYLLQGIVIMTFKSDRMGIANDNLFGFATIVVSLVGAWIMHIVMQYVFKLIYKKFI